MRRWLISSFILAIFLSLTGIGNFLSAAEENVIWQIKPKEGNYMKYFGKRVVDVNRSEADRLVPQEFGWQGNQLIFIFHLTSKQLQAPEFEFSFEIIAKDYDADEQVEIDLYAGTSINNLKTIAQGIKIIRTGVFSFKIPSTNFYLGSQNFIKIFGRNVRPTGYGENPPNCRFGVFKMVIPVDEEKKESALPPNIEIQTTEENPVQTQILNQPQAPEPEPKQQVSEGKKSDDIPTEKEYVEEQALLKETAAGEQDEMMPL